MWLLISNFVDNYVYKYIIANSKKKITITIHLVLLNF
jgi:hypothetical protein